ncbi:MAG: peptidylprolyl isomerase [Casimicrobiaceae bacterium]
MIRSISARLGVFAAAAVLTLASVPALAANPQVEFDTTLGKFRIELYPDAAPKTVANFLDYVKAKFYDGTQFHRVIDGFMIQGGGFTTDFYQKPTRPPVVNEAQSSSKAGIVNAPGTIAMARTGEPNSATSQFFINVGDNSRLNFRSPDPGGIGYTAFGKVVSGMDVVNKIAKVAKGGGKPVPPGTPLSPADVPTTPVVITSAVVVDATK